MFALPQTAIPSNSVGVGVIAQRERRTPLSGFRHASVTSAVGERVGIHERIKDLSQVRLNFLLCRQCTNLLVMDGL